MYLCAAVFFRNFFVSFHIGLILGFPLSVGTIYLSLFAGEGGRGEGGGKGEGGRREGGGKGEGGGEGGGRGGRGEGGGGRGEGKKHLEV